MADIEVEGHVRILRKNREPIWLPLTDLCTHVQVRALHRLSSVVENMANHRVGRLLNDSPGESHGVDVYITNKSNRRGPRHTNVLYSSGQNSTNVNSAVTTSLLSPGTRWSTRAGECIRCSDFSSTILKVFQLHT